MDKKLSVLHKVQNKIQFDELSYTLTVATQSIINASKYSQPNPYPYPYQFGSRPLPKERDHH